MRVLDMFTSLPTCERVALEIRSWGNEPGYRDMFSARWSGLLGLDRETVDRVASLPVEDFLARACDILAKRLPPAEHFVERIRAAGIVRAVVHRPLPVDVPANDALTADLVARFPDVLIGFARIDLAEGPILAARGLERSAKELGLRGVTITPFWSGAPIDDPVWAPVLEVAQDLDLPVWVHCSMHHRRNVPLDIEHPRHVDLVAGRYPDLAFVLGHGGWPWVLEVVATAWRHPRVYIDISAFRPRHVFAPGSGWEPLVRYGEKVLADKIVYGSTWSLLGLEPGAAVAEAASVAWSDEVKDRWLYANAAHLLSLEDVDDHR